MEAGGGGRRPVAAQDGGASGRRSVQEMLGFGSAQTGGRLTHTSGPDHLGGVCWGQVEPPPET